MTAIWGPASSRSLCATRGTFVAIALALVLSSAGCGGSRADKAVPTVTQTQSMPPPADLRDFRYGEVITVFRKWLTLHVTVFNTLGLNDCPPEVWQKLNDAELVKQLGAKRVVLNGPRHWVLNQLEAGGDTRTGRIVQFGGLQFKQVAEIETKIWQGSVGQKLYTENEVQRTTTFVYRMGNLVYELKAPNGATYRMQSYAQIVDPKLTIADLETLAPRLNLPPGWSYHARVLREDSRLRADGLAWVINDDLYNSYQRIAP